MKRDYLLELSLSVTADPGGWDRGAESGADRGNQERFCRFLAAYQSPRRIRFLGRETARFSGFGSDPNCRPQTGL